MTRLFDWPGDRQPWKPAPTLSKKDEQVLNALRNRKPRGTAQRDNEL